MKDSKTIYIVIIAALCLILFCSILVVFGVLSLNALPMTFLGAAMGAVITGVITLTLLQGQQNAQEVKERNVMIFKKKSEIFQKFIDMVWDDIWTEGKITNEQYKEITSFYYKNLMIYMDNEKKDAPSQDIGDAITNLGDCLEKETSNNTKIIQDNVICIINALSKELGLGGEIKDKHIKEHSNKLFPALFRKKILDTLNEELDLQNSTIFKKGQWKKWNEGSMIHDSIIIVFKDYPECSIRIGFSIDAGGRPFKANIEIVFFVPVGANYNRFNDFRAEKTGSMKNRIRLEGYDKVFGTSTQDNVTIPYFNFFDDNKNIEEIQKEDNYKQIAEALAQRTSNVFTQLRVNGVDKSLTDFLEEHYGKR
jgi:hypothetical protein